jgi:RNA polymerase sigma factor for flagellar operon FliA
MSNDEDSIAPASISPDLLGRMRRLAGRVAADTGQAVDEGDLFEAGLLGLAQAVQRWDQQSMTGEFEAYALVCARNAMRQELRDRDLLSRGQRQEVKEVERATDQLAHDLGRVPRSSEVARELGLSFDAYRVIIEAGGAAHVDLDDVSGHIADQSFGSNRPGAMQATEASVDLLHRIQRVRDEVGLLPPRLAEVVHLYYDEGLMQREIGDRLGVTEARVCQLLRGAVEALRERVTQPNAEGKLTLSPARKP